MEQTVATLGGAGQLENPVIDSLIKPLIVHDVNILSPGIWTGPDGKPTRYTAENIALAFLNTNWIDMNLFLDHKDSEETAVAYWVGMVRNVHMEDENIIGDLEIWHPFISMFIKQAKAKFAVSATMSGREVPSLELEGVFDYIINHFNSVSIVDEPGCKNSWLPRVLSSGKIPGNKVIINSIHRKKPKELKHKKKAKKEISSSEESKKNLEICKGVEKMENETKEETATQETEEASTEASAESTPAPAEAPEEKSEETEASTTEESGNEEVKELSSKFDKLSQDVKALTSLVKKSLSAGESSEEETEPEEKSEETEETKELQSLKKELQETKKELSASNEKLNAPDRKSLANGGGSEMGNINDANSGMLGFLRDRGNIAHY